MPWSVNLAAFESRVNGARAVLREGRNSLGLLGVAYIRFGFGAIIGSAVPGEILRRGAPASGETATWMDGHDGQAASYIVVA